MLAVARGCPSCSGRLFQKHRLMSDKMTAGLVANMKIRGLKWLAIYFAKHAD